MEPKDDEYGVTPLWLAAANGHEAVVKLLLEKGAELESKDDKCGCTPLLFAASSGYEAVVKLLLEKDAELESKDDQGSDAVAGGCREGARDGGEAATREGR